MRGISRGFRASLKWFWDILGSVFNRAEPVVLGQRHKMRGVCIDLEAAVRFAQIKKRGCDVHFCVEQLHCYDRCTCLAFCEAGAEMVEIAGKGAVNRTTFLRMETGFGDYASHFILRCAFPVPGQG